MGNMCVGGFLAELPQPDHYVHYVREEDNRALYHNLHNSMVNLSHSQGLSYHQCHYLQTHGSQDMKTSFDTLTNNTNNLLKDARSELHYLSTHSIDNRPRPTVTMQDYIATMHQESLNWQALRNSIQNDIAKFNNIINNINGGYPPNAVNLGQAPIGLSHLAQFAPSAPPVEDK